jgi:hypothetical protein
MNKYARRKLRTNVEIVFDKLPCQIRSYYNGKLHTIKTIRVFNGIYGDAYSVTIERTNSTIDCWNWIRSEGWKLS